MSKIFYNGADPFFPQPYPLVTKSIEYVLRGDSRKLATIEKYSLVGQITGCTFLEITGAQAILNNAFSKDFGTLLFLDDNFTGTASGCKINSIDYAQDIMVGIQNYTINLVSYPQTFFETLGIVSKKNNWSVNQAENQNFTITHEMSAKGANTAPSFNNALDNAKNFVIGLTGFNPPTLFPFFISGFSGSLDTRNETINRLDGTYSIVENYIGRPNSKIAEELSVSLVSGTDGIIEITLNGTFRAGKNEPFALVQQKYSGFDSYGYVTGAYFDYRGVTGLIPLPLSSGVTEDNKDGSVSFNISFNDYPTVRYKHIFNTVVVSGLDGIVTTSINGEIQGLGRQKVRYDNAYNFFTGLNIFSLAVGAYNEYVGIPYQFSLNPFPTASGDALDRFIGKIGYNATFTDKSLAMTCSGIETFDYTISKEFSICQVRNGIVPYSVSGGCLQDLNYVSRASLSVNGNVLTNPVLISPDSAAKQFINNKYRLNYLQLRDNLILDNANLSIQPDKSTASFDYAVSFDEPCPTDPSVDYVFITGLHI